MSVTYISGILIVVSQVLSLLGIDVEIEALNTAVTTIVTIGAGLVVLYRRYIKGDITVLGAQK